MELAEAVEFAAAAGRGVVVTIKRDGRPQLSNVLFAVDSGGLIKVSITDGRAKTANLRRDPRVSLHVTSADFWSYTVIEASADLSPVAQEPEDDTVAELVDLYRAMRGEHPDWADYRRAMVADRRLVLRIRPERAYGMLR